METSYEKEKESVERISQLREQLTTELGKVIIGQREAIEQLLLVLLSGGHALLTGAPGLAKTLLIKSLAELFDLSFNRIQFTPDLMPADITGSELLEESDTGRRMKFVPGPLFANMILADEINRTPPKTQSALLEAMQEHQVTVAGTRHPLEEPFFVLATQNPIEMEGTYPLPEAQLDRFMFNIVVDYLNEDDEVSVVAQTTGIKTEKLNPLLNGTDLASFHEVVRKVPVAEDVVRYAVRIVAASRPNQKATPSFINEWVSWGAGLRAAQYLVLGAKAKVLLEGRTHVTPDDITTLTGPVLRHRILVNYRAEAEGIDTGKVIDQLLSEVRA